jgi:tRNA nucleotidyltransferase (CCA-adding enzyme)
MRAVRFEQRFNFQIEARTLQLIQEARPLIRQVSGDRLRHELVLILSEERATAMLARLQSLGLLSAIHPAMTWSGEYAPTVERALRGEIAPEYKLTEKLGNLPLRAALGFLAWFMAFPLEDALNLVERLKLPSELAKSLVAVKDLRARLPEMVAATPGQITTWLDQVPKPAIYGVSLLNLPQEIQQVLDQYLRVWQNVWPATRGDDLVNLGLKPGPRYREILYSLREAWLNGDIQSAEAEKSLLKKLLDETPEYQGG